jgi:hypothetical protein
LATQFTPALHTYDLLGIVDGSEVCPSKFAADAEGKPTSTINPDFLVWQKKDQFVLAWLNATLTKKVLSTVYGLNYCCKTGLSSPSQPVYTQFSFHNFPSQMPTPDTLSRL